MTRLEFNELKRVYNLKHGTDHHSSKGLAQWALDTQRYVPQPVNETTRLARRISELNRTEHKRDKQGRNPRLMHSVTEYVDGEKVTTWHPINSITPEKMLISNAQRNDQRFYDLVQQDIDMESFNENHNHGAPIQVQKDFTKTLEEYKLAQMELFG